MRKITVRATVTFNAYIHDNVAIDAETAAACAIEQMGGGNETILPPDHGGGYVAWDDVQLQDLRANACQPVKGRDADGYDTVLGATRRSVGRR